MGNRSLQNRNPKRNTYFFCGYGKTATRTTYSAFKNESLVNCCFTLWTTYAAEQVGLVVGVGIQGTSNNAPVSAVTAEAGQEAYASEDVR